MKTKPLTIYRSSAGSGKTFTLVLNYLILAFQSPKAYQHILAITFTNKATEEMKSRIMNVLSELSLGVRNEMGTQLMRILKIDESKLQKQASEVLENILHNYHKFSITTIDSFFSQVIHSFTREIKINHTLNVTIDSNKVIQDVVDSLFAGIEKQENQYLKKWLINFSISKIENKKNWDVRSEIINLAKELEKESWKLFRSFHLSIENHQETFNLFNKEINQIITAFENKCVEIATKGVSEIDKIGGVSIFSKKDKGVAGLFLKFEEKAFEISDTRRQAKNEVNKWLKKDQLDDVSLNTALNEHILPIYNELIDYYDEYSINYFSAIETRKNIYTLGVLTELVQKFQLYKEENEVVLISDFTDFLNQIINNSDTPFIYEKVGTKFKHFLIDEFQDTSFLQWQSFKPLIKNAIDAGQNCLVVGDTKQSIYRWRGGDWQLLQNSIKNEVGEYLCQDKVLNFNWRSKKNIVNFNNNLFSTIKDLTNQIFKGINESYYDTINQIITVYDDVKQETSKTEDEGIVRFEFINKDKNEDNKLIILNKIITEIEFLQSKGVDLKNIAILTRNNNEGTEIANFFLNYKNSESANPKFKYDVISSESLYLTASEVVTFIISVLKWLNNPNDKIALVVWFYKYCRLNNIETFDDESTIFENLNSWQSYVPQSFTENIAYLNTLPIYELIENIIFIFELNKQKNEFVYLQAFQDCVLEFSKNGNSYLPSFLEWWDEDGIKTKISLSEENDAIRILTIHKAKGLEFPYVFIPFLNGLFNDNKEKDKILWCKTPDLSPFNKVPIVPLMNVKNLQNTHWANIYWQEKCSTFLDTINIFYVASTRAIDGLFVYGFSDKNDYINWIESFLSKQENWIEEKKLYYLDNMPKNITVTKKTEDFVLESYPTQLWRSKIDIRLKKSDNNSISLKKGKEFHDLLKKIKTIGDLKLFENTEKYQSLQSFISHNKVIPFFENINQIHTEIPILLPDGKQKRIDRLIKKDGKWVIIDFKTGQKNKNHHFQIKEYIDILLKMGYSSVGGYVIYLEPIDVVEV